MVVYVAQLPGTSVCDTAILCVVMYTRRSSIQPENTTTKKEKLATSSVRASGLAPTLPESWLESTFKNYGDILGIEVSDEKDTADIHFSNSEAACAACHGMNGELVEGQALHVELFQRHSSTKSEFSFKLPCSSSQVQPSTMTFPRGEKSSLFQPVRCGLDLSTACDAMLKTLPPEKLSKPSQKQISASVHVDGNTAKQQAKVSSNVSVRKETTSPQLLTNKPLIKEHIKQSAEPTLAITPLGRASTFKKSTSMPTNIDVHLRSAEGSKYPPKHVQAHTRSNKTQHQQPTLKHSQTEPPSVATLISSTSVDHSAVRGSVGSKIPSPVIQHTQTAPAAFKQETQSDNGSGEGGEQIPEEESPNPFKQALARRPSLVSLTSSVPHKYSKKQMAAISETFKFSDPLVKRVVVTKYNSELKALQKKCKVSIMGEEVDGMAVTLSCPSPGNLKQAKKEITALEEVAQANISDVHFTVSCGFLPCLADPDTVTLLQTTAKQSTTEFTVVTNTREIKLKECCETLKSKMAETKGPLCLFHLPDFTEIRLGYMWKVRNSSTNEVIGFESNVNEHINAAYIKRESTYSFVYNGHSYTVDFSRMTVTDKTDGGKVHNIIKEPVWCRYGDEEFGYKPMRENISVVIEGVFQHGASGFSEIEGQQFVLDFDSDPMQAYSMGRQAVVIQRKPEATSLEHVFIVKVRGITEDLPAAKDAFHSTIRTKLTTETFNIPPSFNRKVTQLLLLNVARKYCIQCALSQDKLALQLRGTKEIVPNVKAELAQHLLTVLLEPSPPGHPVSPPDWEPQDKDIALCPVAERSSEWIHIEQLMKKSLKGVKIVTIERIQNKSLWRKYAFFREHLAKRTDINEKELFHGTRKNSPSKIYESDKGFDFRFGSKNSLWGQGTYFAVKASYSDHGYAYRLSNGQKQLILAKVVTGESVEMKNHENLKAPPLKPGEEVKRYDTVRAKTGGSEIYVIYDHEKAYPAYLISYKT